MNDPLESNSYAVAYRLLGVRAAALAVAGGAAERVRQRFESEGSLRVEEIATEAWLPMLIDFTVDESVRSDVLRLSGRSDDQFSGLREALRRRLVRASRVERVVGALVHLCGYGIDQVAAMLRMDPQAVRTAAQILSPPPGIDYRDLGDPELIGKRTATPVARLPLPYPSTIAVVALLVILILLATRCHGPRPTLVEQGLRTGPQISFEVPDSDHENIGEG